MYQLGNITAVAHQPCNIIISWLLSNRKRGESACDRSLLTASARLIVISTFSDRRFSVWAKGGGSRNGTPPGPTTSVPAGHSDELQLLDQIPF